MVGGNFRHPLMGLSSLPGLSGTIFGDHLFGGRYTYSVEMVDIDKLAVTRSYSLGNCGLSRAQCAGEDDKSHERRHSHQCRATRRGRIYAVGRADDSMSAIRELWRTRAAVVKRQKGSFNGPAIVGRIVDGDSLP